jgi:hypothetical protein
MPVNCPKSGASFAASFGGGGASSASQSGRAQERGRRRLLVRVARREQIGDEMAVLGRASRRAAAPIRPLERHEVEPVLPRADDGREPPLASGSRRSPPSPSTRRRRRTRHPRWQAVAERRSEKVFIVARDAGVLLPCAKLRREANRLRPVEIDATARHEVQLVAETAEQLALFAGRLVGTSSPRANDGVAVDARDGRISVDERRQDRQRVPW